MIEPPKLYTEERKQYDIMELEQLARMACEFEVDACPDIQGAFFQLINVVGTKDFIMNYNVLCKRIHLRRAAFGIPSPVYTDTRTHSYTSGIPTSRCSSPNSNFNSITTTLSSSPAISVPTKALLSTSDLFPIACTKSSPPLSKSAPPSTGSLPPAAFGLVYPPLGTDFTGFARSGSFLHTQPTPSSPGPASPMDRFVDFQNCV